VRWVAACFFYLRAGLFGALGRRYRAFDDLCWIVRVTHAQPWLTLARRALDRELAETRRTGVNPFLEAFLADPSAEAVASLYSITGRGPHDLWRDVIVLKAASADEKGVILLKYARTFSALAALADLPRLMRHYHFVLEPCWAGYCAPAALIYYAPGNPVVVQCFTAADRAFIESVGAPFVPVQLGPADWVDSDIFAPPRVESKPYDIVMVANWGKHKRHAQLFRALREIRDRDVSVLLAGFDWAGRTADDIRREAARYANPRVRLEIREKVPAQELAALVARSRMFVFLSRKEGDNKALVEAMFADVPAIVYDRTVGGASGRINPATGVLASDRELGARIAWMLDHHAQFEPRRWALEHTGSPVATRVLDAALAQAVAAAGGRYTRGIAEKTNAPNLAYKRKGERARFQADYDFIASCLRERWRRDAALEPRSA